MKKENLMIETYYSSKIKDFGLSPEGVDWNGKESQYLRFDQLAKLLPQEGFSLVDIGCGYGALLSYLHEKGYAQFDYTGVDLSPAMIEEAKALFPNESERFRVVGGNDEIEPGDFAVASGIFNVRQEVGDDDWKNFIIESLHQMNRIGEKGFSFNILTSYSDIPKRRDYLYYASPEFFFKYCKENFSRNVALLHDYDLYEFTIIVRK